MSENEIRLGDLLNMLTMGLARTNRDESPRTHELFEETIAKMSSGSITLSVGNVTVKVNDYGVCVRPVGYGDAVSQRGEGWPVVVETQKLDGGPLVLVFGDINDDAPTHRISLDGASEWSRNTATGG